MNVPSPQRYVVVYRPAKDDPLEYIGPFVSKRLAEQFADTLKPEGKTFIRPLLARHEHH
jgi:hypothetical protein